MKLKVKQMNGNDFEVELEYETPSVQNLLELIAAKLDITVDCQRLIFSGRVLSDRESTLASAGVTDGSVVHLVVRPADIPPTSSVSASPSVSSTGVSTGAGPRQVPAMQFQTLGNGVTVGSMTIDHSTLSGDQGQGADIGSLISQMVSSLIPPSLHTQGPTSPITATTDNNADRTNVETIHSHSGSSAAATPAHTQDQQQLQQQQQQQQQQTARNLFLAHSHLQALQRSHPAHTPPTPSHTSSSSLAAAMDTLATSLHSTILPVMQLGQSLHQHQQNPYAHTSHHLNSHNDLITLQAQQAEIFRVQNLLHHLSEATGHLAGALQHTYLLPSPSLQQQQQYQQQGSPHTPFTVFQNMMPSAVPAPPPSHFQFQPQPPFTQPLPQQQAQQQTHQQAQPQAEQQQTHPSDPPSDNSSRPTDRSNLQTRPILRVLSPTISVPTSEGGRTDSRTGRTRTVLHIHSTPSSTVSGGSSSSGSSRGTIISPNQQHFAPHLEAVASQIQRHEAAATATPVSHTGTTGAAAGASTGRDTTSSRTSTATSGVAASSSLPSSSSPNQQETQFSTQTGGAPNVPHTTSTHLSANETPPSSHLPGVNTGASTSINSHSLSTDTPSLSSSPSSSSQPSPATSIRASVTAENQSPGNHSFSTTFSTTPSSSTNMPPSINNPIVQNVLQSLMGVPSLATGARMGEFSHATFVNGVQTSGSGSNSAGGSFEVPSNYSPGAILAQLPALFQSPLMRQSLSQNVSPPHSSPSTSATLSNNGNNGTHVGVEVEVSSGSGVFVEDVEEEDHDDCDASGGERGRTAAGSGAQGSPDMVDDILDDFTFD